jgi:hypothetical protein
MFSGGTLRGVGPGGSGLEGSTIPPASTGVANPAAGVAPGEIKRARHNSGSNIRIPYARVVPTREQSGDVGLPTLRKPGHHDYRLRTGPKKYKTKQHENEDLAVGNIVFVRGVGKESRAQLGHIALATPDLADIDQEDLDMSTKMRLHTGTGVDKLSRLCTFEYAKRFFEVQRFKATMALPVGVVAGVGPFLTCPARSDDRTPFGMAMHSAGVEGFKTLKESMQKEGLLLWTPDGIVVGKDHVGDEMDAVYDSRLNQLFNVAVQGPATTTEYCNDPDMLCLPNDNVFVLVVCDSTSGPVPADLQSVSNVSQAAEFIAKYEQELRSSVSSNESASKTQRAVVAEALHAATRDAQNAVMREESADTMLYNFRLVLSTSSQMVRSSGARDQASSVEECFPTGKDRLGLLAGFYSDGGLGQVKTCRQYVLGGWSIGHVLDSAATRPYTGMYNPLQNPLTSSLNVFVNCKWWNGNALHEAYCSGRNAVTNRYEVSSLTLVDKLNNARCRLVTLELLNSFDATSLSSEFKSKLAVAWTQLAGMSQKSLEETVTLSDPKKCPNLYRILHCLHCLGVVLRASARYDSAEPALRKSMAAARVTMRTRHDELVESLAAGSCPTDEPTTKSWLTECYASISVAMLLLHLAARSHYVSDSSEEPETKEQNHWMGTASPVGVVDRTTRNELMPTEPNEETQGAMKRLYDLVVAVVEGGGNTFKTNVEMGARHETYELLQKFIGDMTGGDVVKGLLADSLDADRKNTTMRFFNSP